MDTGPAVRRSACLPVDAPGAVHLHGESLSVLHAHHAPLANSADGAREERQLCRLVVDLHLSSQRQTRCQRVTVLSSTVKTNTGLNESTTRVVRRHAFRAKTFSQNRIVPLVLLDMFPPDSKRDITSRHRKPVTEDEREKNAKL